MSPPLLVLKDIRVSFGGPPLLDGVGMTVSEKERLCLVGRNGSGKSTLLKIAAGVIEPDGGERTLQQGTSVRYLPQEPDLSAFATTLAYVEAGLGPHDDAHRARYLLNQLGLSGEEDPRRLSGGEIRRAALARALAPAPDVLLLDEPTNHLDLPAIEWLEKELSGLRSALVIISHDRRFLTNLSQATLWIDRGTAKRLDKGFGAFEEWRDGILEQEETERHKMDRKIAAETDWSLHGISARRKRNQGRLRALRAMRQERREWRKTAGGAVMAASESAQKPKLIIDAEGLSKSYGERAIVRNLTLRVLRGDRIGIVGPNGAGKTTLLNLLTGQLAPDGGQLKLGVNLEIVTIDQKRDALDPEKSLKDNLTGGSGDQVKVGDGSRHVVGYLKDFLFQPEQAGTPVSALSGGERGRLMLAKALARSSNLMVLDEPTNDLDLETLDLLQEVLGDYDGTVLLVSHDRDFLDRVVTAVVAYEGDGRWAVYAGGYSDMVAQRGEGVTARKEKAAAQKPAPGKAKAAAAEDARAAPRRRLGFKEKHALETLPGRMAELQKEIKKQQALLDDAGLYARDPAAFTKATEALQAAAAELDAAEEQWLELEMLREEIESERSAV